MLAALSGPDRVAGAVAVADPWRLLARRLVPEDTGILARLGFWRVQLMLADSGLVIASAGDYALLGTLLVGPACRTPAGRQHLLVSRPRAAGSRQQATAPAARLSRHPGEPR